MSRFRFFHESAFSGLYLHIITLSNIRFMLMIFIDQVPVLYLYLVSGALTFVSRHHLFFLGASVVLLDQSEALFTFDR